MGKARVEYDRENCIGAGACVAANSDWWSIDADGKANLKNAVFDAEKKLWILELEEADVQKQVDAAGVCPVTVIHVYDKDGKQLF
jgi:ferredoxin